MNELNTLANGSDAGVSVKDRLIIYIEYLRISIRAFEMKAGLSNGYVNNISKSISLDKLQKIKQKFPDLNLSWITLGDGDMCEDNYSINNKISTRISDAILALKINKNEFATTLGYKRPQSIYDYLSGKVNPSYEFFNRFGNSEYAKVIDISWLIAGKGEMIKTDINQNIVLVDKSDTTKIGEAYLLYKSAQTDTFEEWLEKYQTLNFNQT